MLRTGFRSAKSLSRCEFSQMIQPPGTCFLFCDIGIKMLMLQGFED